MSFDPEAIKLTVALIRDAQRYRILRQKTANFSDDFAYQEGVIEPIMIGTSTSEAEEIFGEELDAVLDSILLCAQTYCGVRQ